MRARDEMAEFRISSLSANFVMAASKHEMPSFLDKSTDSESKN